MSPLRLLMLAPIVAVLAGCGSEPKPRPALAPVRLEIDGPPDPATVDQGSVEVHGRVFPRSAQVLVAGDEAGTDNGAFSAVVQLDPGANVIDVEAAAPNRVAAMTALRVVRRVPVEIPDLGGLAPEDAVRRLRQLGLRTKVEKTGGLIDDLLPGTDGVCGTDPGSGEQVKAGSVVTVSVAKAC